MMNHQSFKSSIDACFKCAAECEHCATECLKEDDIKMLSLCLSLNRECALVCHSTAALMSMGGDNATLLCEVCADICLACADECERNIELDYCRHCAEECRRCAEECRTLIMAEYA